jgi:pimeloyl-ACP methyl ester carboxylesterase
VPWVSGDGVRLALVDEGDGSPVVLLHGFPDSSQGWRHQVPALTAAGLRVLAPDLRGFGESDKPEGVEAYGIRHSIADVVAMLNELEIERAHVVGHDWGAAVAWLLAAYVPDRVDRLVAMSVGHPGAFGRFSLEQRRKFWYQLLFQFDVAEELLMQNDWELVRAFLAGEPDLERFIADLERPGALTAGLNWYRANSNPRNQLGPRPEIPDVAAPTLGLWSDGDRYLTEDAMVGSASHVTGPWRYERIDGAGHWLQLEVPDRVNGLLLDFLA